MDLDLERFFDRANHDVLRSSVAARETDKRVLELIRAFLNTGVLEDGLIRPAEEGALTLVRSRPSSVISCSTSSTRSWLDVAIGSVATRTTSTCMFAVIAPASGPWPRSPGS